MAGHPGCMGLRGYGFRGEIKGSLVEQIQEVRACTRLVESSLGPGALGEIAKVSEKTRRNRI